LKLGTRNVRNQYGPGSLKTVARELPRCKVHLVGVQEVMWDKWGRINAGDSNIVYGKGNENHQLGTGFFVHHRIVS